MKAHNFSLRCFVIFGILAVSIMLPCFTAFADIPVGGQKVVLIDENNKINAPEVIASVADMITNKTEIAIAKAAADAAKSAVREGTNLVATTISKIVQNEFVVYRHGETDSLGVLVALPEDTKCQVIDFSPNIESDANGRMRHELIYATTENADVVTPAIKYSNTINKETSPSSFTILPDTVEWGTVNTVFTNAQGTVYNYAYSVKFWTDASSQGYFIVYLDADDAIGEGQTFDIVGGITGGLTAEVPVASDTLVFKGGLLVDIKKEE